MLQIKIPILRVQTPIFLQIKLKMQNVTEGIPAGKESLTFHITTLQLELDYSLQFAWRELVANQRKTPQDAIFYTPNVMSMLIPQTYHLA